MKYDFYLSEDTCWYAVFQPHSDALSAIFEGDLVVHDSRETFMRFVRERLNGSRYDGEIYDAFINENNICLVNVFHEDLVETFRIDEVVPLIDEWVAFCERHDLP